MLRNKTKKTKPRRCKIGDIVIVPYKSQYVEATVETVYKTGISVYFMDGKDKINSWYDNGIFKLKEEDIG